MCEFVFREHRICFSSCSERALCFLLHVHNVIVCVYIQSELKTLVPVKVTKSSLRYRVHAGSEL
jgi:hypothetical protein